MARGESSEQHVARRRHRSVAEHETASANTIDCHWAARHQVVGYVRNMPDGSVESLAEGSSANVEAFKNDLVTGPQWAAVAQVEELVLEPSNLYSSFRIER